MVALLLASSAAAARPTGGYATYSMSFTSPLGEHSVLVNESVTPSARVGFSDLVLQVFGGTQNLTYSKLVNASENLFPYLPSVGTQSFEYSNGTTYSVRVNVTTSSTATVAFAGGQYALNVFDISVSASYGTRNIETNGTLETFPSTLVYSASVGNSTAMLRVVLQATDLPLTASSTQMSSAVYVGTGLGIGAIAVGGALMIRHREKKTEKQGEKPLHWVD
jgi:hypothetical protein